MKIPAFIWRNIPVRIVLTPQISKNEKISLDKTSFRAYHTHRFSKNRAIRGAVVHQSRRGAVQAAAILRKRVRRRNANLLEGVQVGHTEKIRMTVTVSGGNRGALLPDEQHCFVVFRAVMAHSYDRFLYFRQFQTNRE